MSIATTWTRAVLAWHGGLGAVARARLRRRGGIAAAVLPLVLLASCVAASASDREVVTAPPVPPAAGTTEDRSRTDEGVCLAPLVSVTAPAPGVALRPGSVVLAGVRSDSAQSAHWSLARVGEVRQTVNDGYFLPGTTGQPGSSSIVLDLPVGSYAFRIDALGGAGTGACSTDEVHFSVSDSVAGPTWTSGASGDAVPTGEFGAWRGTPLSIAGAWADSNIGQRELWQLRPGGQYGDWTADIDFAIGAIERHESWAAAAQGAYDDRWARSLQDMARLWAGRPGTFYLRFAHEFNGTWFPWSVTASDRDDFVAAWQRFRALQVQYFPTARLVFTPNYETPRDQGLDWRTFFPGSPYVDVISIPYFNAWPYMAKAEEFWQRAVQVDAFGAPAGIVAHLDFARSVGLPFAVSEWGPHARFGDAPVYMEQMNQLFREYGGTGAGQLLYEVLFNVPIDGNSFALMPSTNAPLAAERYRALW